MHLSAGWKTKQRQFETSPSETFYITVTAKKEKKLFIQKKEKYFIEWYKILHDMSSFDIRKLHVNDERSIFISQRRYWAIGF